MLSTSCPSGSRTWTKRKWISSRKQRCNSENVFLLRLKAFGLSLSTPIMMPGSGHIYIFKCSSLQIIEFSSGIWFWLCDVCAEEWFLFSCLVFNIRFMTPFVVWKTGSRFKFFDLVGMFIGVPHSLHPFNHLIFVELEGCICILLCTLLKECRWSCLSSLCMKYCTLCYELSIFLPSFPFPSESLSEKNHWFGSLDLYFAMLSFVAEADKVYHIVVRSFVICLPDHFVFWILLLLVTVSFPFLLLYFRVEYFAHIMPKCNY